MITIRPIRAAALTAAFALTCSLPTLADDMVSFATAGYASGLRTPEVMHKIDTNGDGMVSREEWLAFHEKVFTMLDTSKTGKVDAKQFISHTGGDVSGWNRRDDLGAGNGRGSDCRVRAEVNRSTGEETRAYKSQCESCSPCSDA